MHLYEHDKQKTIHLNILAEILKLKINVPQFGKVGVYIRKMLHIPKKYENSHISSQCKEFRSMCINTIKIV